MEPSNLILGTLDIFAIFIAFEFAYLIIYSGTGLGAFFFLGENIPSALPCCYTPLASDHVPPESNRDPKDKAVYFNILGVPAISRCNIPVNDYFIFPV